MKNPLNLKRLLEGVDLEPEEKGILKSLGSKNQALNLDSIKNYLEHQAYENVEKKDIRKSLEHLSDLGYVRSKTKGEGNDREEVFYLSNYVMGGIRRKSSLQNRGPWNDLKKFYQKFLGSIFLLVGLGFFIYYGLSMTGAVVSSGEILTPGFVLSFVLFVVGMALLEKKNS